MQRAFRFSGCVLPWAKPQRLKPFTSHALAGIAKAMP
jgi:hypothetical protein